MHNRLIFFSSLLTKQSTGAIHFGVNCFGICGDADGNGDPNAASNELTSAGGSDNPDFKLSESFCLGMDLGGGAANEPGIEILCVCVCVYVFFFSTTV